MIEPFPWKIVIAIIIFQLILVATTAKADTLQDCNLSYSLCAGKIYEQQASSNVAKLLIERCGKKQEYINLLDLRQLPVHSNLVDCQNHLAACGYTYIQQYAVTLTNWNNVKQQCKGR